MPYNYSDSYLTDRASHGGKDAGRMQYADALVARAQAGDQSAIQELAWRSGVAPDPNPNDGEGAWATADARNYGQMQLGKISGGQFQPRYDKANDGSFGLDDAVHGLGSVLKTAAPFAGLIPGVGLPLAGALAAGGSALGGALHGDKFDLGKTLMAGAAGAGGSYLMGGQGFHGLSGAPGRLGSLFGVGGHNPTTAAAAASAGNATQAGAVGGAAATGAGGAVGGAGGLLGAIGKYGPMAMGAMGAIGAGKDASQARELRDQATQGAMQDWRSRQPVRDRAQQLMLGPIPQAPNLNPMFADPGNPFYRPLPISRGR